PEVWRECLRVLKPGAFALVFGGTRTFHRLAVALEDAGFELKDTLMWVHSQGFPKSYDVSKGIDKALGAKRPVIATIPDRWAGKGAVLQRATQSERAEAHITAPATPEAERWQGYGTALKPAYEPILLVRKPTPLTFARNALRHGTGALNIDGARVPTNDAFGGGRKATSGFVSGYEHDGWQPGSEKGRWPSNLIHDGSDEVVSLFPSTTSRGHTPARRGKGGISTNGHRGQEGVDEAYFDTGSAARFFYATKASTR